VIVLAMRSARTTEPSPLAPVDPADA